MKQLNLLLASILLFVIAPLQAQISQGGTPIGKSQALSLESVPVESLPTFNLEQVAAEDAEEERMGTYPRIGRTRALNLSPSVFGEWKELDNGGRLWRGAIKSRDAQGLSVQFENFELPEGGELFIYSADFKHIIGAFTSFNNHESGIFSTQIIPSDEVIVEYYEPTMTNGAAPFAISGVIHCYRMVPGVESSQRDFGASESCQVNVNCSEGNNWQDEKRGVVRILIIDNQGAGLCSGSLVNNTAEDCTPYMLTALHCGISSTASNMNSWVFYFNYESSGCSNGTAGQVPDNTMTGCSPIADSGDGGGINGSDYMLVELNNDIPDSFNPYYNGWRSTTTTSSSGVSIHHPSGDIKKVSTYNTSLQPVSIGGPAGTHWLVEWSSSANGHGVTEGGSSGSPIFDVQGRIIGTLTGGTSFCTALDDPDVYGRMSYHWNSNPGDNLSDFLDPIGSGATSLEGSDAPCETSGGGDDNNDDCANAITVTPGVHAFSTVDATTDGPAQPGSPCDAFEESNVANDVWYEYTASCDGLASLSTCGTVDFDTRIAVYPGGQCPPTAGSLIICNDDFGDCADFSSYAEWEVTEGSTYLLRIGGYSDEDFGTGTLELTEECGQTGGGCITDIPYPEDDPCVIAVVDADEYCCDTEWDEVCQGSYDLCDSGVDCAVGDVSVSLQQNICPDELGSYNALGLLIPEGGGYGVSFTPDGGTGGDEEGFSITGITQFPFEFDADINGLLSGAGYLPLAGQWTATGFVYADAEDIGGSICDISEEVITLNFLSEDDAACDESGDCITDIPYPEDDPCVLVVLADDEYCCNTEWDEVCEADYEACAEGEVCEAGAVSVELEQDICPNETGIFDADGVVIPEGGGYAVQFVPDGGTGGPGAGFSITGVQPLPFEFDSELNGVMSGEGLPPLEGTWLLTGFTYTNPDSAAATFCSIAEVDVVVNFLLEGNPACDGGGEPTNVESFEGTFPPACWTMVDADGDTQNWFHYGSNDPESPVFGVAQDGNFCAGSASWFNDEILTPDNYLITPQLSLSDNEELIYWVAAQDPEWSEENYAVMLSTTGNDPADFTINLFEETLVDDTWLERTVDLSAYSGQDVYLAFRHYDVSDQFYIKIDNVALPGEILPCGPTTDECLDWVSPTPTTTWPDFNDEFGGAPTPDENGDCAINEFTEFQVWKSEAYAMDNIQAGVTYTFSHCNGPDAGTWLPEYTIIAPSGAIDAYGAGNGDGCSITWVATESGTYTIVINEADNCGVGAQVNNGYPAITCSDEITSVEEITGNEFTLFPNPNSGQFNIQYVGEAGVAQVEVLEVSGKVVKSTQFTFNSDTYLPVDLGQQANGMYFVRITMNDEVIVQKVMVH